MSKFKKIAIAIIVFQIILIGFVNWFSVSSKKTSGRLYRVEIMRIQHSLMDGHDVNPDDYSSIIAINKFTEDYRTNNDYTVILVNGEYYAIEYRTDNSDDYIVYMNIGLALMLISSIGILVYVNTKVLKPFHTMSDMTVELARGNLTTPIKEDKNKFFGRFIWGMDMLRENLESKKEKELELQKEKKTLILSISHDIKTPLSAIKLYTKALNEGIYDTAEKRSEAFAGIDKNTQEIERYVNEIVTASKEDFLNLEANISEFYIKDVIDKVNSYYKDKFETLHTEFVIDKYDNCLISGDPDRLEEVIQNLLENAIKYGDGSRVTISMDNEEDCRLIMVSNTGCTLKEEEIPHLFDSFYRGTNAENQKGSGLGLYIARSLMHLMDGEVFAQIEGDIFSCVIVARKA